VVVTFDLGGSAASRAQLGPSEPDVDGYIGCRADDLRPDPTVGAIWAIVGRGEAMSCRFGDRTGGWERPGNRDDGGGGTTTSGTSTTTSGTSTTTTTTTKPKAPPPTFIGAIGFQTRTTTPTVPATMALATRAAEVWTKRFSPPARRNEVGPLSPLQVTVVVAGAHVRGRRPFRTGWPAIRPCVRLGRWSGGRR